MKFRILSHDLCVTYNAVYETISNDTPFTYRCSDDGEKRFIDDEGAVRPLDVFSYKKIFENEDEEPTSPLVNPESKHYEMIGGKQSVEYMEQMFTREEMMAWAKVTAMKYALRAGRKNITGTLDESILSDIHKKISYEDYYKYLEEKA